MEECTLDTYKCLTCGAVGMHNYDTNQDGEINDNDWAGFSESLECDECGNHESVGGWIDGSGYFETEEWAEFEENDGTLEITEKQPSATKDNLKLAENIIHKGKEGERDFNNWLNDNKLSYLYVDQSVETFSTLFKGNVKRPDFLLLLESVGMIAIDVKNHTQYKNSFSLNMESEFLRSLSFERLFRLPLWYAYKSENNGRLVWLWISALKALEVGVISINSKSKEKFLRIDVKHFEEISTNEDIGKLYTHRINSTNNLSN